MQLDIRGKGLNSTSYTVNSHNYPGLRGRMGKDRTMKNTVNLKIGYIKMDENEREKIVIIKYILLLNVVY